MQYLAKHASDFPDPRPYGLIRLGAFMVLFMTYILPIILTKA